MNGRPEQRITDTENAPVAGVVVPVVVVVGRWKRTCLAPVM